jgi:membrane protein YqaA with SNARE-associated domain
MAKRKKRARHTHLEHWWRRYMFKHTTLAIVVAGLFILAIDTALVQGLFRLVEYAGLFGIFVTGILFVSFITVAPATLILVNAATDYDLLALALVAGAGSIIGDWLILRFFEDKVGYELQPLAKKYGINPTIRRLRTKKFRPFAIAAALLILASPWPDEAGLGLLGLTKTPVIRILPLIFVVNSLGIYLLALAARNLAAL